MECEAEEVSCTYEGCNLSVPLGEWEDHQLAHLLGEGPEDEDEGQSMPSSSALDDLTTCTKGMVPCLEHYYPAYRPRGVTSVSLSGDTWHMSHAHWDSGWGCGYRNMQMVLSCLLQMEPYKSLLAEKGVLEMPSIPRLQQMIEEAWAQGFDAKGREQLQGKVSETRKWIGTTEVASVFRNLNLRALVVDFVHPTGVGGTHPRLFQWVRDYFSGRVQRPHCSRSVKQTPSNPPPSTDQGPNPNPNPNPKPGDSGSTAAAVSSPDHGSPPGTGTADTAVSSPHHSPPLRTKTTALPSDCHPSPGTEMTAAAIQPPDHNIPPRIETTAATGECLSPEDVDYPPIYFQHEGHSRTIIGLEERGHEALLLVLDPLHSRGKVGGIIKNPGVHLGLLLRGLGQVKMKEYELVFVDGVLSDAEKEDMKVITPFQRIS